MSAPAAQLPVFHVVGFTGHRQLKDPAAVERVIRETLRGLRTEAGVEWLALSSIAEGADMLFARSALRLGMGWEAVLPLPPAEFRADFHPEKWRDVETLLAEAEHVRVIGERSHRDDAYLDCGMETVNHCDLLLTVWNGEPSRGRGGTAEIVAYARDMGRPVIVIDAHTLAVRRENFERLQVGDRYLASFNRLPAPPPSPGEATPERELVTAFQRKVDLAATRNAPHFRRLQSLGVGLFVLSTMQTAATVVLGVDQPWARLACLLVACGVALRVISRRLQNDWMRHRLAAEITRSALATWGLPRALRLFDEFEWQGIEPLRRSLDILQRRAARRHPAGFDEFKQRYLRERIDGQLAYFARHERQTVPLLWVLRIGFLLTLTLAICVTAAYAQHSTMPGVAAPSWVQTWIYGFGLLVLPALAIAFIALIAIHDLYRRVARYHEMRVRLATARKEATYVQTWGALERVVAKAERALLAEVFEWHSITSFTESR
ncbi:MAG: hypothetical protein HZA93_26870 [Verrucomicrobia bacterium]|nr:hypothetical protein [Verrucomicrobiota bacterium]